jgi:hypothetical protein
VSPRAVINWIGGGLVLIVFFWLVGIIAVHPTPAGAAAVGAGVREAITFLVDALKSI